MNGRRSGGFSSLNYNTGVKEGSLKGYTLYLLLTPGADAGKTRPWLQLNEDGHKNAPMEENRPRPLHARLLMHISVPTAHLIVIRRRYFLPLGAASRVNLLKAARIGNNWRRVSAAYLHCASESRKLPSNANTTTISSAPGIKPLRLPSPELPVSVECA